MGKEIYIKKKGFDNFYKAIVNVRKSHRGHKVATLTQVEEVTKYRYYQQPRERCFVEIVVAEGLEIGRSNFFERLEALE